jgi:hypothetical protein
MQQNFRRLLILGLVGALAVAAFGATALAVEDKKSVCAFEDGTTKKCVVGFVCEHENTQMCDVVIQYLKTHKLLDVRAATERRLNEVCEPDGTFMCTCCDVKAGCYPCPKKLAPNQ